MTKRNQGKYLTGGPVVDNIHTVTVPESGSVPKIPDPWKHRSKNMSCVTCMWYSPKVADGGTSHLGRCRRRAPTMAGYPAVFEADWCGDHKLDENKIVQGGA